MSRDPRKVWRYYAQALVQEKDPEKISYLTERLFEALAENDEEQLKPNRPRPGNAVSG
jgi:hypothetical protein